MDAALLDSEDGAAKAGAAGNDSFICYEKETPTFRPGRDSIELLASTMSIPRPAAL